KQPSQMWISGQKPLVTILSGCLRSKSAAPSCRLSHPVLDFIMESTAAHFPWNELTFVGAADAPCTRTGACMNRTKSLVFLVVAGILQGAPSLTAQQQTFEASVPFQFSAGNRTLPAGEYRISRHGAFIHVQNQNGYAAVLLASAGDSFTDGQTRLVFDHVNDQFFLRRVVAAQSVGSIELAVT